MALQLIDDLRRHARSGDGAPAARMVGEIQALSYGDLNRRVEALSRRLIELLPPDSAVVLCYPNGPQYIVAFLAVLHAGQTLFPIAYDSTMPELQAAAGCSSAAAVIGPFERAGEFFRPSVPLPELAPDAALVNISEAVPARREGPALLLQSSGTTGGPKIVRRDGPSLDAVARNMVRACGFAAGDRVLAAVPLCHSYGLEHGILAPITAGSCVHVSRGFDLSIVLPELRDRDITILPGVPFMFDLLCQAPREKFAALRQVYSAGGPLPRTTFDSFYDRFGLRIGQIYGATEIGSVTFGAPDSASCQPPAVGMPMDGVSIRVLDVNDPAGGPLPAGDQGQVAVAAPSMLSEYLNDRLELIDGHFVTGDLGIIDLGGTLRVTGRLKLLIDIGGRKVNPAEVESVLRQHPDVGDCVVLPMPLSPTVCRLKAVVTPARPDAEVSAQDLRRFARERLSGYKVPRIFEVRDRLPTSPAGKVLRHLVEAQ